MEEQYEQYDDEPYSPKPKPETPWVAPKMKIGVYKRKNGRYQVYFSHEGKQIHLQRLPWGTPLDSDVNVGLLKAYLRKYGYHPEKWGKDTSFQFSKATATWIKNSNVSQEWLTQRKNISKRFFIPYFKSRDIRTIQTIHIQEFYSSLKSKHYSPHYLLNVIGELKALFRSHRKSLKELPDFPKITVQEPVLRWLTAEDQEQVYKFIPTIDLPIFQFLRRYGCRTNEASGLLKQNVFLDHTPPYVVLATVLTASGLKPYTKTKRIKILPIIPELKWLFESGNGSEFVFAKKWRGEWLPYTSRMLNRIWNKANKESGIAPINLYNGTRHSFGCQRLNQGFSRDEVRAVMGHTSTKTTERYAAYQLESLQGIIQGIYKPLIDQPNVKLIENKGTNQLGSKVSYL